MTKAAAFLNSRHGGLAVGMALAAVPILAATGLAVTYASALLEKTKAQQILDAAVLAGTSLGYSAEEDARLSAAYTVASGGELTFDSDKDITLKIDGSGTMFTTKGTSVLGSATIGMPNVFAGLIGDDYIKIVVTSKAVKRSSDPLCVLALNSKEPGSIEAYGNATLQANCGVMANSTDKHGIKQYGAKSKISGSQIGVTGDSSGKNIAPKPTNDVEPVSDPYASLPVPKAGPCVDVASKLSKGTFTLDPGTYCGGLNITPGAVVNLNPGIYIMLDGQLSIGANSNLQGQEVMIAFVGIDSVLSTNSGTTITLTSPKSGTYQNIQFMSDRKLQGKFKGEEWMTLSSTTLEYDGVMYLPEQDIWFKGGSQIKAKSPTVAMMADQFWVQDTSDVQVSQENTRDIDVALGAPTFKYSARLAE